MGNTIAPCCNPNFFKLSVKVIFWEEGTTKILTARTIAGQLMFQFPNMVLCHADSFYIGHPIPELSIEDELVPGETYFMLPVDRFACRVLSVSSVSSMVSSTFRASLGEGEGPFQYVKGVNGKLLIKISPEFLTKLVMKKTERCSSSSDDKCCGDAVLITTPELKQHYDKLVGHCKESVRSPKLESISERKRSPINFLLLGKKR